MLQEYIFLTRFASPFTFYPHVQETNEKLMNKISQNFKILKTNESKQVQKQPVNSHLPKNADCKSSQLPSISCNKYMVKFTGLNRNLSKMAYEYSESIKSEVATFPKSKGIVGNLPAEWIQKIPKENRANAIKELYSEMKAIVNDFRLNVFFDTNTTEKLNEAFAKAGIAKSSEKIKIAHIDDGFYGSVFALKGLSDDKYVIKIFKSNDEINKYHGNYIEPNRAAFWQKRAGGNTQMVPFHFADVEAGYMVNKYIDEQTPQFKKYISPKVYGLKSADICDQKTGKNVINGFQIDYGGIKIEERNLLKKNMNVLRKKPRRVAKSTIQNFFQKLIDKITKKFISEKQCK